MEIVSSGCSNLCFFHGLPTPPTPGKFQSSWTLLYTNIIILMLVIGFLAEGPVGQFELKHNTQHKSGSMYILCVLIRYVVVWCRESLLYHSGSVHQHGIANIRCISSSWSERATVSLDNDIIMVYLQPGLGNNFHIQWILRNLNSKTCTSNCYIGFHRNAV